MVLGLLLSSCGPRVKVTKLSDISPDILTKATKVQIFRLDNAQPKPEIEKHLGEITGEITNDELGSINADSHIIWTYDWEPEEGDYDVQAEVYDVSPAESNLGNNILETTVSVTAEGVDLAVIEVWTGDSDPIHNEHIAICLLYTSPSPRD